MTDDEVALHPRAMRAARRTSAPLSADAVTAEQSIAFDTGKSLYRQPP
jgi:hypothetical protein